MNAPHPPQHTPPQDPNEQLAKDVAKAGALGCLGGIGAFGVFALIAVVGVIILFLVITGLIMMTCGGH